MAHNPTTAARWFVVSNPGAQPSPIMAPDGHVYHNPWGECRGLDPGFYLVEDDSIRRVDSTPTPTPTPAPLTPAQVDCLRQAIEDRNTLRAIVRQLDGREWHADTCQTLAHILRAAGWTIRDVDETETTPETQE